MHKLLAVLSKKQAWNENEKKKMGSCFEIKSAWVEEARKIRAASLNPGGVPKANRNK
jgi:hypothetical protein